MQQIDNYLLKQRLINEAYKQGELDAACGHELNPFEGFLADMWEQGFSNETDRALFIIGGSF